jgi:hypothetical protein
VRASRCLPRIHPELARRCALPAILLVAFALRLYRLGDMNIWWDEGLAIWAVRKSLLETTLWTAQDVHPPLYFWTLWAWVRLVGESEFAARFISVICGVLTVAVAYVLGRRLGGRRVGLLGALLLALSRFHVWWSQEMRMYVLAALAATVTLYAAARWLEEERECARHTWLVGYILGATASLYTIYMAVLAPLVANGYALLALLRIPRARRWRAVARWSAAQAVVLLLLVPWLALALPRMHSWSVAQPFGLRALLSLYASLLAVGVSTQVEHFVVYAAPFAFTLLAGIATLLWRRRRPAPGLPGWQAASLLAGAVASLPLAVYVLTRPRSLFYTPRVEARYLVLFAPAFAVFVAWSAVQLERRSRMLGLAALASCLGVALAFLPGYYGERYLRDEMQTMAHILGAYARPGDEILLISGNRQPVFSYYYERLLPPERRVPLVELPKAYHFTAGNVDTELEAATAGLERFWVAFVEAGIQDPEGLSLPWLDRRFRRVLTHPVGYNALILYGDEGEPLLAERSGLSPERRLSISEGGLELLGYDLPGREYRPGDVVDLGLYWASPAPVRVEVQWLRDDGELLRGLAQEWPATGAAAGRAAIRFTAWPWYGGGGTHFVLRWTAPGGSEHTARLRGPRILAPPGPPLEQRIAQPLDMTFAGGIRLRGYDLHRPIRDGQAGARAGDRLTLDLFWQAAQPVGQDFVVFTHLVGSAHNPRTGGLLWGQHDGPPVDGRYATSAWVPGELILDRHVLDIDPYAPAGDYELRVGLYLPATMTRLRLLHPDGTEGDDHLALVRISVRR